MFYILLLLERERKKDKKLINFYNKIITAYIINCSTNLIINIIIIIPDKNHNLLHERLIFSREIKSNNSNI